MITFYSAPKEPLENEEIHTLFDNIDLILKNADVIIEKFKNVRVKGTGIDGIYIGHKDLFLSDLICLWNNGTWRNGEKFYYHLGGSPFSGTSFCAYWEKGKIGCDRNKPTFGAFFKPADRVFQNLRQISLCDCFRLEESTIKIKDLVKLLK